MRINRYTGGNKKIDLFNMKGEYDADDIMNGAKKDDDDNAEMTQTGHNEQPVVPKKNNFKKSSQQKPNFEINDKTLKLFRHFIDPNDIKDKSASKKKNAEELLSEQGIPASEIKLAKILMDKPAPHCSAQSWAVYDQKTNTLLFGKMEREKRECASLTKIMTAYTVFKLMERFGTDESTLITVSPEAAGVIGTSAELLEGDSLQI